MTMPDLVRHLDATDYPDDRVDYPEIVDEFRAMGFVQIGRVLAAPVQGTYEDIASDYDAVSRERFLAHCDVPTPILRAPDGSAFVDVSWHWQSPSVRIRTELADGSLVETNRRWKHPPELPLVLAEHWKRFDIDRNMTKRSTPQRGRSVEIASTQDTTAQWRKHQEHLARYSAQRNTEFRRHDDVEQYIMLAGRAFRHDTKVERRTVGFWKPLVLAYGAIGLLAVSVLALTRRVPVAIAVAVVLAALTQPFVRLVISKVRILPEFLRPPYL